MKAMLENKHGRLFGENETEGAGSADFVRIPIKSSAVDELQAA
jgi:hypothetical protein